VSLITFNPERVKSITKPRLVVPEDIDGEPVNDVLKEHSLTAADWDFNEVVTQVHEWAQRFNAEFRLGLQTPAIRLDHIGSCRLGTYRPGRNGFGLRHEVTLNTRYLNRPFAATLATLLHELLHQWQDTFGRAGRNNYHNRAYRTRASLYGLIVDERGHTLGIEPGRFTNLLSEYGVDTLSLPIPGEQPFSRLHGNSKMHKWQCGCTTVRCAVTLVARCERCGLRFEEAQAAW
jgi:hypothetical protein